MQRIAVIGAGPAGLATAYVLTKHGLQVDVYEAGPVVGGLTRTFELWDERVDLGPHIFGSYTDEVFALWREVVGPQYSMLKRTTRVMSGGRLYNYPLRMQEVLRGLGPLGTLRAGLDFIRAQLSKADSDQSAETVIVGRFGRRLYETFFRSYCQKLWGSDASQVDASFAQYLIGDLTVSSVLYNALLGRRSARERELQDEFPYAHDGSGTFSEQAALYVRANGGTVQCNSPVRELCVERNCVTGLRSGDERRSYDWVVSSMPIGLLARALDVLTPELAQRLGRLRFRSTILVYLRVYSTSLLPYLWVYATDGLSAGRVTNFSARRPGRSDSSILCVEYWCDAGDPHWQASDDALTTLAISELSVLARRDVSHLIDTSHVIRIERSHPLHYRGYAEDLRAVRDRLANFERLSSIGRAGAFSYDSQAAAIDSGLQTARYVRKRCHATSVSAALNYRHDRI